MITDDEIKRKRMLTRALFESKSGEISECDECGCLVLREHLHTNYNSKRETWSRCPDCDLPEKWHAKFSNSRGMRYYVYFDPDKGSISRIVQWSHPTEGNPLHIQHDHGEHQTGHQTGHKRNCE